MNKKIMVLSFFLLGVSIIGAKNTEKRNYVKIPKANVVSLKNKWCQSTLRRIADLIILRNRAKNGESGQFYRTEREKLYKTYTEELYGLLKIYDLDNCSKDFLRQVLDEAGFYTNPNEGYWNMQKGELEVSNPFDGHLKTSEEKAREIIAGIKFPEDYRKVAKLEEECDRCAENYKEYIKIIQQRAAGKEKFEERSKNSEILKNITEQYEKKDIEQISNKDLEESLNKINQEPDTQKKQIALMWFEAGKNLQFINCDRLLEGTDFFEKIAEATGVKNFKKILNAIDILQKFIFYKNKNA